MTAGEMTPKVDEYLGKAKRYKDEFTELRRIALECGLTEDIKWKNICFMSEGKNVVLIHGFKEYFALLFMKGVLIKDPNSILIQQTPNVQSARQIRFTSLEQVTKMEPIIKAYIEEAIAVEKSGVEVEFKKQEETDIPEELQRKFDEMPAFREAFEKLTPGRQRAYILFFAAPKQAKTRESRIEKNVDRIMDGIGLNDRF
ncbi:YdeI/OmpD-associated family protein [Paenilisteria rocourtiae]|uniref:Uncharacterized protein YdeI (YjbR/CyaY-like superfamily) n=1 Tax=Listeria rocourtiae TaxID=647910 RepID=A0A4R6ZI65_9LIST|nr:YdeI/OmpD-associated family protein [Listeria rocourtiae]EUJ47706.1 hypothetical protein PROCOU_07988 [Listeria rocourtiae FSL F6-920]TDR51960.1 uncharacterized protein YdeI (YjbR/CyaY-like superfamily) [Listeria rocourtiae]